jgi:hypothetical protein
MTLRTFRYCLYRHGPSFCPITQRHCRGSLSTPLSTRSPFCASPLVPFLAALLKSKFTEYMHRRSHPSTDVPTEDKGCWTSTSSDRDASRTDIHSPGHHGNVDVQGLARRSSLHILARCTRVLHSWHGILTGPVSQTFGLITVSWLVLQSALGAGSVWFDGAVFGGGHKAKLVWKYHRLSGYILLLCLLVTVNLGGAWSSWTSSNSAYIVRLVAYTLAPLGILVSVYSRLRYLVNSHHHRGLSNKFL